MIGSTGEPIGRCHLGDDTSRKPIGAAPARCRRAGRQNVQAEQRPQHVIDVVKHVPYAL